MKKNYLHTSYALNFIRSIYGHKLLLNLIYFYVFIPSTQWFLTILSSSKSFKLHLLSFFSVLFLLTFARNLRNAHYLQVFYITVLFSPPTKERKYLIKFNLMMCLQEKSFCCYFTRNHSHKMQKKETKRENNGETFSVLICEYRAVTCSLTGL